MFIHFFIASCSSFLSCFAIVAPTVKNAAATQLLAKTYYDYDPSSVISCQLIVALVTHFLQNVFGKQFKTWAIALICECI